ncbi:MAG TPA: hypothetical protein VGK73_37525 [Polyangiaceae bacterium]
MQDYLLTAALAALVIGYPLLARHRAKKALAAAKPAFVSFFQRTGWRYSDIPDSPPEAQAERAYADAKNPRPASGYDIHYVRDYHGVRMHYVYANGTRKEGSKTVFWYSNHWEAEIPHAPRVPLHIADKSLDSTFKAAKELFSSSKRVFTPKCSQRVRTGVPELDAKLVVFGENQQAVEELFRRHPELAPMLSDWAELDISITQGRGVFADPLQHNMNAAVGGTIGSMALGFDYAKRLELAIPVHDRVADLFAALIRATA